MRLLDACCGPGYVAGAAAARGVIADGIDIAANMVALATELYPAASFRTADAGALPYPDEHFDAVVCNFGLHHLTDVASGVAEFARVLRPGGRLAATVWDDDRDGLDLVPSAIYGAGAVAPADLPSPPDVVAYDEHDQVTALFEPAGLSRCRSERLEFMQRYPDRDALWDGWLAAAIRTGPLYRAQPIEVQRRARASYDRTVRDFEAPDGSVEIPVGVIMITARGR